VPGCGHSSSVLIIHACLCASICACYNCVIKVININKYKQNSHDFTCNTKVETEIDVHSNIKQAVKLQVFRHATADNTNTYNTTNVSIFQTLGRSWIVIPSLPSSVHYCLMGPSSDALWLCVPLYMSLHVHIVPNFLLPPPVACPRHDLWRKPLDRSCTVSCDFFWLVLSPV